jgi:hypothetical protein
VSANSHVLVVANGAARAIEGGEACLAGGGAAEEQRGRHGSEPGRPHEDERRGNDGNPRKYRRSPGVRERDTRPQSRDPDVPWVAGRDRWLRRLRTQG